jgi:hypothetical protein
MNNPQNNFRERELILIKLGCFNFIPPYPIFKDHFIRINPLSQSIYSGISDWIINPVREGAEYPVD